MKAILVLLFSLLIFSGKKPAVTETPRQADSIRRQRIVELSYANDREGILEACRDLIDYHVEQGNERYIYDAYATLFDRLHLWGRFDEALAVLEEMSGKAQEQHSGVGMAITNFCFGQFYLGSRQSDEAEKYYRSAFQELPKYGQNNRAIRAGFNLQAISMNSGVPEKGLLINDSTQVMLQQLEERTGTMIPQHRFKQVRYRFVLLQRMGDLKAAAPLKDSLLHYAEIINDPSQDDIVQTALIQYEQAIGEKEAAYARLDSLIAKHLREKNFEKVTRYRYALAEYQRENGDYDRAIDTYRAYAAANDSALRYSTNEQLNTLTKKYELNELRLENRAARSRIAALILLAALLLVTTLGLMVYARTLRQKNLALYQASLETIHAEEEMELSITERPEQGQSPEEQLYARLISLMNQEQVFKDPELNRDDLSNRLGTNRTYLSDAVKACTGQTLSEFVNRHRLRWAAETLASDTDSSVISVGEDAGFNSRSTFYRLFQEQFGMSPSDYRATALRTAN